MRYFISAALLAIAAFATAQNAYFTGTMSANDPTWGRPLETGTGPGSGTNVFYDVQPFYVAANGTFTFETVAPQPNNYDTFIFIYKNAFNPATPLVNFHAGDDDFTGAFTILPGPFAVPPNGTGSSGTAPASQILNTSLLAGTQYYAINTTFSNGAVGTYFSGIGGRNAAGAPIDVTLGLLPVVPEPGTMAVLGIGALALLRKRRK